VTRLPQVTRWAATHRTGRGRDASSEPALPYAWAELVARRAPQLLAEPGQRPSGARRGGHAPAPRFPELPAGSQHRAVVASRWPELTEDTRNPNSQYPQPAFDESGNRDLWPSLPDDTELWLVPRTAFSEVQLRYLDQEQEGRPWNG
jgi:hypothetical protein